MAAVHRQVRTITEQHGWLQPSYATVHSIIRGLDPGLVMLAHDGPKKYADRFELLYRREASRPNEMWQADHTPLDLWILDERGQPGQPGRVPQYLDGFGHRTELLDHAFPELGE